MSSSDKQDKSNILNWADKSGSFKRQESQFRHHISAAPGADFPPEKGRYHLYVSYACPWAHRVLIVRALKGLEDILPFTSVHWSMLDKGWRFAEKGEDVAGANTTPDPLHPDFAYLRELYFEQDKDYGGRFTVPVLYDTKTNRIVSNESAEIIRMLYHEFDSILPKEYAEIDLLPKNLEKQIKETNEWTYHDINNGVYKSGFATQESVYVEAVTTLFKSLDRAEKHLSSVSDGPFYFGSRVTEADVRLFTTIVRFDPVYVQHFKCNIRDIRSGYPYLHKWMRNLYWNHKAFGETTQFEHIKKHYTKSHRQINPHSITPVGPLPDILPLDEEVPAVLAAKK